MTVRELASRYRSRIIVQRWLATLLDCVVLFFLCASAGALLSVRSTAVSGAVFVTVPFVYYVAFETAIGRTPGKILCALTVVNEVGRPPGFAAALIRTATRFVEVNPLLFGGIPAGIVADRSRYRQRLGDMLAGTYVVFRDDLLGSAPVASPEAG